MENVDIIDISHQIDAIIQGPYLCRGPTRLVLCQDKMVRYNSQTRVSISSGFAANQYTFNFTTSSLTSLRRGEDKS